MELSRQEYWSGQPFPSPVDLLHSGIEPGSPTMQADSLLSEPPGESQVFHRPECVYLVTLGLWLLVTAAMKLKDAYSLEGKL